jgi:hypothetical protein
VTPVYVIAEQLDASGNIITSQNVAAAVSVTVTNMPAVAGPTGTLPSPITIAAGANNQTANFTSQSNGVSNLVVTEPTGFTNPANNANGSVQQIQVSVNTPGIAVTGGITIGLNLEVQGSFSLGAPAGPSGVDVVLTAHPGLLLALNATDTGATTLTIHVPSGGFNGFYYIQAVGGVGAAPTYSATATGYNSRTSQPITIAQSAVYLAGPNAFTNFDGQAYQVMHGTSQALTLYMVIVDGSNKVINSFGHQTLAGGFSKTVNFTNTNAAAGTVTSANPASIPGGTDGVGVIFTAGGTIGQSTQLSATGGANPVNTINVN